MVVRKKIISSVVILLLLAGILFSIAWIILKQENKELENIFCVYKGSQYLVTSYDDEHEGNVHTSVVLIDSIDKKKQLEESKLAVFLIDTKGNKQKVDSYSVTEINKIGQCEVYRLYLDFKVKSDVGEIVEYTKLQVGADTYNVGSMRIEVCKYEQLDITITTPIMLGELDDQYFFSITNELQQKIEMVAIEYDLACEKERKRKKFEKVIKPGEEQEFGTGRKFQGENVVIIPKLILKVNGKMVTTYSSIAPTITDVQLTKEDIIAYLEGMKE